MHRSNEPGCTGRDRWLVSNRISTRACRIDPVAAREATLRVCLKTLGAGLLFAALAALRLGAQGNPEAAKIQNPVPASPASIAAGKQSFMRYCANCHGLNAEGSPGNDLTPEAPDLTGKSGSTDRPTARSSHDQERRGARLQHGRIWRSVEGRGHLERRELREVAGQKNRDWGLGGWAIRAGRGTGRAGWADLRRSADQPHPPIPNLPDLTSRARSA